MANRTTKTKTVLPQPYISGLKKQIYFTALICIMALCIGFDITLSAQVPQLQQEAIISSDIPELRYREWLEKHKNLPFTLTSLTAGEDGFLYVTGRLTGSVDVDFTEEEQLIVSASSIMFVGKYTADWELVWAKPVYENGGASDYCFANADKDGNVFITGNFNTSLDFQVGEGEQILIEDKPYDSGYLLKLDVNGTYLWSKEVYANDRGFEFDENTNLYLLGQYREEGAKSATHISKYDKDGNLLWDKQFELLTVSYEKTDKLTYKNNNLYYFTEYRGGDKITVNNQQVTLPSTSEMADWSELLYTKLDSETGDIIWYNTVNGSGIIKVFDMVIDGEDNLIVSAFTYEGELLFNSQGEQSIVEEDNNARYMIPNIGIHKISSDGQPVWTKYFQSRFQYMGAMEVDASNNIYFAMTGVGRLNFHTSGESYYVNSLQGDHNSQFMACLNKKGDLEWARTLPVGVPVTTMTNLVKDKNNDFHVGYGREYNNTPYFELFKFNPSIYYQTITDTPYANIGDQEVYGSGVYRYDTTNQFGNDSTSILYLLPDDYVNQNGGGSCEEATLMEYHRYKLNHSPATRTYYPKVWYKYSIKEAGKLTISTCGEVTPDTYVEVYLKCGDLFAENDDFCGGQSELVLDDLRPNDTVYIAWTDYWEEDEWEDAKAYSYIFNINFEKTDTGNDVVSGIDKGSMADFETRLNGIYFSNHQKQLIQIMDITGKVLLDKTTQTFEPFLFQKSKLYIIKVNQVVKKISFR